MTPPRPGRSGRSAAVPVTIVHACLRDGAGGSPTAVVEDTGDLVLDNEMRRAIPALVGASHAVFLETGAGGDEVPVRFFTSEGELPGCGHGTVAALAYLAERPGAPEHRVTLLAAVGGLRGRAVRRDGFVQAEFEVGPVALREPTAEELGLLLPALGLPLVASAHVATLGRPRLLVRLPSRGALEALSPDLPALADACRDLDLLGCFAYAAPAAAAQRHTARMFAPAIGVPEDIANANSTACLAALMHATGDLGPGRPSAVTDVGSRSGPGTGPGTVRSAMRPLPAGRRSQGDIDAGWSVDLAVDMGDRMGSPATISARVVPGADDTEPLVRVGGAARVTASRQGS